MNFKNIADTSHFCAAPPCKGFMDKAFSIEDALVYLDKIKCAYGHRPEVYGKFLAIMKEFKMQIIKTDQVIQKIAGLFADNEHLIAEFTNFLPCEADAAPHTASFVVHHAPTKIQQAHAMQYVIKVRNRFIHYPLVYSRFLDILQVYHSGRQNISEVLEHVAKLLADQEDLLGEFVYFLPEALQDQAKARMDQALQECESRRQQRQQQDPAKYHYPLPCSSATVRPELTNQSLPYANALSPLTVPDSVHPKDASLVAQVENDNIVSPLPRTSVALSVSSDSASHRSSSSLSTTSSMSAMDFEVIPLDEADVSVTKSEPCMHSAQPTQPTQEKPPPPAPPAPTAQSNASLRTHSTDLTPSSVQIDQTAPTQQPIQPNLLTQPLTGPTESTQPTEQVGARTSRPAATCFHAPTITISEAHSETPIVGTKRKKNSVEDTPGASYNPRGRSSGKQKAPIVTPTPTPINTSHKASTQQMSQGSGSITMEQLWAHNVQMSAAMADLDRRLGTVECLVDLQRKRVEGHKAEIVALKGRISSMENGKN